MDANSKGMSFKEVKNYGKRIFQARSIKAHEYVINNLSKKPAIQQKAFKIIFDGTNIFTVTELTAAWKNLKQQINKHLNDKALQINSDFIDNEIFSVFLNPDLAFLDADNLYQMINVSLVYKILECPHLHEVSSMVTYSDIRHAFSKEGKYAYFIPFMLWPIAKRLLFPRSRKIRNIISMMNKDASSKRYNSNLYKIVEASDLSLMDKESVLGMFYGASLNTTNALVKTLATISESPDLQKDIQCNKNQMQALELIVSTMYQTLSTDAVISGTLRVGDDSEIYVSGLNHYGQLSGTEKYVFSGGERYCPGKKYATKLISELIYSLLKLGSLELIAPVESKNSLGFNFIQGGNIFIFKKHQ
ncbi:hypothetical protein [Shewanella surugensis]|uniref:Cytochrome P450 n=1 Tax=Shewanella surugensis TaxID=212020 RepID=A0ABT0LB71_9GAMM|nr:hypothetical protein [Shewanella surugensis]MCL1124952.1 hypothetical protein [Shewanella surugensis]